MKINHLRSNNIRQFGSIVAQVESSNQITQIMLFLYFMEFYGILYWFFPFYSDWKQSSVCRTSWMFLTCLWREEGGVHRSVSPSQVAASNECRIFLSILCIFATCLQHRHKPVGLMTRSQFQVAFTLHYIVVRFSLNLVASNASILTFALSQNSTLEQSVLSLLIILFKSLWFNQFIFWNL